MGGGFKVPIFFPQSTYNETATVSEIFLFFKNVFRKVLSSQQNWAEGTKISHIDSLAPAHAELTPLPT